MNLFRRQLENNTKRVAICWVVNTVPCAHRQMHSVCLFYIIIEENERMLISLQKRRLKTIILFEVYRKMCAELCA